MTSDSKDKNVQPTPEERSRLASKDYSIEFEERNRGRKAPMRKGRRLDVDGILAGSLPKTISQPSRIES